MTDFNAGGGRDALLAELLLTVGVIFAVSRLGLPSSVTLALTGAILGIGVRQGLPVDAGTAVRVILVAVVAPIAASALSAVIASGLSRTRARSSRRP